MTEPLADTWFPRDLPVLRTIVRLHDTEPHWVRLSDVARELGLEELTVFQSLRALEWAGFVTWEASTPPGSSRIKSHSAGARRETGAWPTPESGADRVVAALEQIAHDGTEDERTRAQKILGELTGAGRQIAIGVATAVATGQVS